MVNPNSIIFFINTVLSSAGSVPFQNGTNIYFIKLNIINYITSSKERMTSLRGSHHSLIGIDYLIWMFGKKCHTNKNQHYIARKC